ncbi:Homeodomain-like protein [Trichoderma parareesei]|uniref:Homeodomain-like protein n=1 Tax=Trichoderma parareesei TaxID=858221 RepID=A0A2H2ZG23_TRIPA|nr:Homeodomain-like protein [Trichoderma parareesei]
MTVTGYIPKNEPVERHEQGVTKSRKTIMTGGGRAWSEAEEQYLVRTRHQKVPYKQIAANLKKTELACRLHYHQLTHSSARRRHSVSTTPSASSASSRPSEMMTVTILGPGAHHHRPTASLSAHHRRAESYSSTSTASSSGDNVQLPRIVDAWASPTLPVILPRPSSMVAETGSRHLPRLHEELCHLPPPPPHHHHHHHQQYHQSQHHHHQQQQQHMETPAGFPLPSTSTHPPPYIDMTRLHALYDVHRDAFWHAIARDYGWNASPTVLESAWRDSQSQRNKAATPERPLTPADSPEAPARRDSVDRTSIASLLADASPGRW